MRVARLPVSAVLSAVLLTGALSACSDDVAETPGGPPSAGDPVAPEQAPAVEDDTGGEDPAGSTTGDQDQLEPTPSG